MPSSAANRPPRPWRQRYATPAVVAAWAATGAALPWVPPRAHAYLVGLCVAGTVLAVWRRSQAPVQAAFIQGMLFERDSGNARHLSELRPAVGGDGNVVAFPPRRPAPRRP